LQQLVLHQPGRLVANTEVAREFQRGDIVLGLGHQVHGEEPAHQRQLGCLEDRAGGHRGLVTAAVALPVVPLFTNKCRVSFIAAARTDEALRPARRHQRRVALRFRSVARHELHHRQTLLKLHVIDRHL
jgi:hypothetical protein